MNDIILQILSPLITQFLASISPSICTALKNFAKELWERAQETNNPWDNVLAALLYAILGIETPKIS